MPTYDYACTACGHAWEASHSMKDSPIRDCPKCGKDAAQRQISGGAGFILKGGGWYNDLYASSKSKGGSDGGSSGSAGGSPSSGSPSGSSS